MQKKIFVNFNRWEVISVVSLVFIFSVLMFLSWGHLGNIVVDCGREAYFPAEILKGKVLYKDIFNIFGPFSYLLNAFFYKIFGVNFNTLYTAGFLTFGIIITTIYCLMRVFTSREISWAVTLLIMISCGINPYIFNYVFPYAYAMTYAFSAFLLSVLFLILCLKTSKQFFIPFSWFFLGISIASKYEYILYFVFLFLFTIFVLKPSRKYIVYSLVSFLAVPVICFSILFWQGLTLADFINQMHLVKKFAMAPSLNWFYKDVVGLYPEKLNVLLGLKIFGKFFGYFVALMMTSYFLLSSFKNRLESRLEHHHYDFKRLIFYVVLISVFSYKLFSEVLTWPSYVFVNLPFLTFFVACFVIIRSYKLHDFNSFFKNENGMFLTLLIIAVLASVKTFFFLSLKAYGTFTLPLLLLVDSIFVVEYLPKFFKFIDKNSLKKAFFIVLFSLCFLYTNYYVTAFNRQVPIKAAKGTMYIHQKLSKTFTDAIGYIDKKMAPADSFMVMPEGIMLNFLTGHPSSNIHYSVMMPYIETFGEDKIISDIKKNPPNYIFISNRKSSEYGKSYMCKDYGVKICDYVKSNYTQVSVFGTGFKMVLYKRKID